MATYAIWINKEKPKKDGTCGIYIRITHERISRLYGTRVSMTFDNFNMRNLSKEKSIKEGSIKINFLEKKAVDIIKDLDDFFTWEKFESKYLTSRVNKHSLKEAFEEHIKKAENEGRIGTANSYKCAMTSINKFNPDAKISDVNVDFLKKYEKYMLNSNHQKATIGIYTRSIRTIFNSAIEKGIIRREAYPFGKNKFETPTGRNIKKALTIEEIELLYKYKCDDINRQKAKDFWFFSYFCNGINIADICDLRYGNVSDKMITWERAKTINTKRDATKIIAANNDFLRKIIEKWGNIDKSKSNFVFPIFTEKDTPIKKMAKKKQFIKFINMNMKEIGIELGFDKPLTTYVARHSFGTVLMKNGKSMEFIKNLFGHSSSLTPALYMGQFTTEEIEKEVECLTSFLKK